MAGADGYDPTARSMITQAHAAGKHAEYRVISRRSNCFNDRTGLDAGTAARDYRVGLDYYYNGKSINGMIFQGWTSWSDARAASYMGYGQMINDWRTIIVDGIPDPAQRTKKMFCGGHSAGGLTLSALAAWDFDGNPATTEDPGYNLWGGFVALDTGLISDPVGPHRAPALEGPFMRPNFTIFAGDGVAESTMGHLNPVTSVLNPQGHQLLPTEVTRAPGYQHVDILMAAPKQNNGQLETSSTALTTFLLEHSLG